MKKWSWQTKRQFIFISVAGNIYAWCIKIGRFEMSWERR